MEKKAIRNEYASKGVEGFYKEEGSNYNNPHEKQIKHLLKIAIKKNYVGKNVLDLACGSGEVTLCLKDFNVTGADPYTQEAYLKRTKKKALSFSFKDIVEGKLYKKFDTIICSFAMHLVEKSMLSKLLFKLSEMTNNLIILTPHKNPIIKEEHGWKLKEEIIYERVRLRVYEKNY